MSLPKDPIMLLSVVNTQLRDHFPSLEELEKFYMLEQGTIEKQLSVVGYQYDKERNAFV